MAPSALKVLIDTDACIDLLRGRAGPNQDRVLRRYDGAMAISSITAGELETGFFKGDASPERRKMLDEFLALFPVLPFDAAAARGYGRIRAALERTGTQIGALDQLIAAHALNLSLSLVTGNLQEFRRVPGLKCVNWRAATAPRP